MIAPMSAEPLFDKPLAGTPFRGLVIRGFLGLCAYIGVPQEHWAADMDDLVLQVHGSITFSAPGDGVRPQGWYWWGWDYSHWNDSFELTAEMREILPPEMVEFYDARNVGKKRWTLAEVEQDLIDAAVELHARLQAHQEAAAKVVQISAKTSRSPQVLTRTDEAS